MMPILGEYLSGWYIIDNLLYFVLTSLSVAFCGRSRARNESLLLCPAPSAS